MKTIAWHVVLVIGALAATCGRTVGAQQMSADGAASASLARNVYKAGATVRPSGPVEGDFIGVGGRVTIDHPVTGDALLAGGSVEVGAAVGDDARIAGGDVNIDNTIGGELFAIGGNVSLTKLAQVQRGATLAGGLVTIDGKVAGRLDVKAQRVVLNGEVNGDTRLVAESIRLGPTARLNGALRHVSREFSKAEGAVVTGATTQEEDPHPARGPGPGRHEWHWAYSGPTWVGSVMGYLGLLAAGGVFLLLFPRFSDDAPATIGSAPWLSLAVGFGTLVGVPALAVLLFVSLLGIPLGIAAFALYPLLLLAGYLTGVLFVAYRARLALRPRGAAASFRSRIAFVALALLVLMLIGRLPAIGSLTVAVTLVMGLGACGVAWYRRRTAHPASPT